MVTVLSFIFVLGVLVFIHEFGHFIVAKMVGIRVERFSLGFPPRMIGKKVGDTDYCISWIPIGGYVKMSGMIDESFDQDSIKGEPWEFMSKPVWQRFLVIFAGPLMNILLAVFIFAAITYFSGMSEAAGPTVGVGATDSYVANAGFENGDRIISIDGEAVESWSQVSDLIKEKEQISVALKRNEDINTQLVAVAVFDSMRKTYPPVIGEVVANSPAAGIGLLGGDRITEVNGVPVATWDDLTTQIHQRPDEAITIGWSRDGEIFSNTVTPLGDAPDGKGRIGISLMLVKHDVGLFPAIGAGFTYTVNLTKLVYDSMKMIFSGKESFKNAFGGPIAIAKMAGDSARSGAGTLFMFMAFLSLNLGFLNLLPIPVLDGGHIVFLLIEGIIRRPISTKVKLVVQQIGIALLLALMFFVIVNDIRKFW